MKPGVIVNISRNYNDCSNANPLPNDWYREEKWKRISDWVSEVEKETLKNNQELALLQIRRIKNLLDGIKNKEKGNEKTIPSYFIADVDRLNRNWDRITHRKSDTSTLEQENAQIREEILKLDEMKKKLNFS
jgi:uncharacterized protein HemY